MELRIEKVENGFIVYAPSKTAEYMAYFDKRYIFSGVDDALAFIRAKLS